MAEHPLVYVVPSTELLPDEPYRLVRNPNDVLSVAVGDGTPLTPHLAQFINEVHNRRNDDPASDSGPPRPMVPVQRSWKSRHHRASQ